MSIKSEKIVAAIEHLINAKLRVLQEEMEAHIKRGEGGPFLWHRAQKAGYSERAVLAAEIEQAIEKSPGSS